jgi:hypothetical protein
LLCEDESTNQSTMTNVLKQIVNYENLGILAPMKTKFASKVAMFQQALEYSLL